MKIKHSTIQLILFALILFAGFAFYKAAFAEPIDPTIAGQETLTLSCVYPVEREDGTALAIDEIAKVSFYVTADGVLTHIGDNTNACQQVIDLTAVADNTYIYSATTTDTHGRTSIHSVDNATLEVKRLANPKAPSGMSFTLQ